MLEVADADYNLHHHQRITMLGVALPLPLVYALCSVPLAAESTHCASTTPVKAT